MSIEETCATGQDKFAHWPANFHGVLYPRQLSLVNKLMRIRWIPLFWPGHSFCGERWRKPLASRSGSVKIHFYFELIPSLGNARGAAGCGKLSPNDAREYFCTDVFVSEGRPLAQASGIGYWGRIVAAKGQNCGTNPN